MKNVGITLGILLLVGITGFGIYKLTIDSKPVLLKYNDKTKQLTYKFKGVTKTETLQKNQGLQLGKYSIEASISLDKINGALLKNNSGFVINTIYK